MEFLELEEQDGVRMAWNVLPGTKPDASNCVLPISVLYTPIKTLHPATPLLSYSPLRCNTCRVVLNPFCVVDFSANIWICPFCFHRNSFPSNYSVAAPDNLPPELSPCFTTIEYVSDVEPSSPPVMLLVIDMCMYEEELCFLKSALSQIIDLIRDDTLVGLITFDRLVYVHELGFCHIPKSYVFRNDKVVSKDVLLDRMEFFLKTPKPSGGVIAGIRDGISLESLSRFFLPASECSFAINKIMDDLHIDCWPVAPGHRSSRCTGTALSIAGSLLGACFPGSSARIAAFIGGPSTEGLGYISSLNLSEPLRSHKDIVNDSASYYDEAVKFYMGLARQLTHQGHCIDIFASALDQVGIAELKGLVETTGGFVVLTDSFGNQVFKESLKRAFQPGEHDLPYSSNCIFEVNCSKELKVQGVIGPCASLEKKGAKCSETVVGQGNTTAWKMSALSKTSTLSVFLENANSEVELVHSQSSGNQIYIQFLTYYLHSSGHMRLRVTTISRRWVAGPGFHQELVCGFDQEAAAVVVARLVSLKMENEGSFDPLRWLDEALIKLCSLFGEYKRGDVSSFNLPERFSNFPMLIFHLRRSQFVQVGNYSPDETAFFRLMLNRETVANSLKMIQASLISFSVYSEAAFVPLDVASVSSESILVLDSYFSVVVFHGAKVAHWRKSGYHLSPEPQYQEFAEMLKRPVAYANQLIQSRFPFPRLVICDQYSSQARFLLAKLNPSSAYDSDPLIVAGDVAYSDDVSFEIFQQHLHSSILQIFHEVKGEIEFGHGMNKFSKLYPYKA